MNPVSIVEKNQITGIVKQTLPSVAATSKTYAAITWEYVLSSARRGQSFLVTVTVTVVNNP